MVKNKNTYFVCILYLTNYQLNTRIKKEWRKESFNAKTFGLDQNLFVIKDITWGDAGVVDQ